MTGAGSATSVVVSTYDDARWDDLAACVESLRSQALAPLEVIVVVDHNPSLLERARSEFPDARVVPNERARGLAGARNSGIAAAAGEVIAFIDDDARAEPQWLERLATCFEQPGVVGAGGALVPRWEGREARWLPPEFYWVVGCSYAGLPQRLAPIRNPIGANMAVRAEALREIGGFREGTSDDAPRELRSRGVVRAGGNVPDDTDLAIRVSQRWPEAVWLYQPEAVVHHTVTSERATLGYFTRRCYEEGVGKAHLAGYVGSGQGLSSERRHLVVAIPRGLARALGETVRGDASGAARAAAILAGVFVSGTGFLVARMRRAREPRAVRA